MPTKKLRLILQRLQTPCYILHPLFSEAASQKKFSKAAEGVNADDGLPRAELLSALQTERALETGPELESDAHSLTFSSPTSEPTCSTTPIISKLGTRGNRVSPQSLSMN